MKIFEFDISWEQGIRTQFAQDDIKLTGKQRVETDNVRIVAPSLQTARIALDQAFAGTSMMVRTPPREIPINIFVRFEATELESIQAHRRIGPEELNDLGRRARAEGL